MCPLAPFVKAPLEPAAFEKCRQSFQIGQPQLQAYGENYERNNEIIYKRLRAVYVNTIAGFPARCADSADRKARGQADRQVLPQ